MSYYKYIYVYKCIMLVCTYYIHNKCKNCIMSEDNTLLVPSRISINSYKLIIVLCNFACFTFHFTID